VKDRKAYHKQYRATHKAEAKAYYDSHKEEAREYYKKFIRAKTSSNAKIAKREISLRKEAAKWKKENQNSNVHMEGWDRTPLTLANEEEVEKYCSCLSIKEKKIVCGVFGVGGKVIKLTDKTRYRYNKAIGKIINFTVEEKEKERDDRRNQKFA